MARKGLASGFERPLLCSGLSPQLLEKWILSEKEWEREKAINLHLHLMQIYVQSVGVCVSPEAPDPPACRPDTHREMPVSMPGEETLLKSSSAPRRVPREEAASLGNGEGDPGRCWPWGSGAVRKRVGRVSCGSGFCGA